MRKELATAARSTPSYIPDRVFSDAIFAVLASDTGASRRLRVELHDQIAGCHETFQALPDPETGKALVDRLDQACRSLRARAAEATTPEAIMAAAESAFGEIFEGIMTDDPSLEPAVKLLEGLIADPATAPNPTADPTRLDSLRNRLVTSAGSLPDGPAKTELSRLAGQTAWFAAWRTSPEPRAYLSGVKADLEAKDKARRESLQIARDHMATATTAVLAVGPKLPAEELVRDHVWEALGAAIERLGAAVATLPPGPLQVAMVAMVAKVSAGLKAQAAQGAMTLDQARDAVKQAFVSFRGTLDGLKDDVDWSKVNAWVGREEAQLATSEGDLLTLAKLRDAVASLPHCDVRVALLSLMDEVGDDLDGVKQNIQSWYNDTMERVSGWYKRTTQVLLAIIAVGLTGALNADTIRIAERLWDDPVLRAQIDAEADLAAKAPPPLNAPNPNPNPADPGPKIDQLVKRSGLPLGWSQDELIKLGISQKTLIEQRPAGDSGVKASVVWAWNSARLVLANLLGTSKGLAKLTGLALTAIAVSMGAPFWFDVLNKLVNVRTSGLRPAKTADNPTATPSGP